MSSCYRTAMDNRNDAVQSSDTVHNPVHFYYRTLDFMPLWSILTVRTVFSWFDYLFISLQFLKQLPVLAGI